jgi:thioredoxin 1
MNPGFNMKAVTSQKSKNLTQMISCGCLKAPALEELAAELDGKVTVAKLNIDENPNTPTKYGVRGVPTLMIFQQGQVAATKVGALPKSKIKEWIEASI